MPEVGDAIIASNHISGLDPLLLIAVTNRPIRFLIAREEYNRFGLTWLFRAGGCIPIDRSGNVVRAMSAVIQALQDGEIVAIFPEGIIQKEQENKKPLKRGIALLAEVTNSTIYPVHITGVRGHGHVLRGVLYPSKVTLTVGKKMTCFDDDHDECLQKLSQTLHP
ncbi:Acyl-CoA:1-acyl-sn-glycerol-3-phosphate acyltransferase [hydrothermal vent metagenome]|uniref:Acyl-CoA:1-acyl-sn-glycerol-3-phosphate acyltransferase n=1 Tax=hydrothermal vent metagenome TaxID=652676 RepID=A0A3B0ZZS1_9ZZZZ